MRDKPAKCYSTNCPLAVTCKCGHHLNTHPDDGHCGEMDCTCKEFTSKSRGFALGTGDPTIAKIALIFEGLGQDETTFVIRPLTGRRFFETAGECDKEVAVRRRDYSHISCPRCHGKMLTYGKTLRGLQEGNQEEVLRLRQPRQETLSGSHAACEDLQSSLCYNSSQSRQETESSRCGEKVSQNLPEMREAICSDSREGVQGEALNNSHQGPDILLTSLLAEHAESGKGYLVRPRVSPSPNQRKEDERAPLDNGESPREKIGALGARSSQEWNSRRQPSIESSDSGGHAALREGSLPPLHEDLLSSLACVYCGANELTWELSIEEKFLRLGAPVVGRTGSLVESWLFKSLAIASRHEIFIDNTLRCLPPKNKQGENYPIGDERKEAERCCRQWDRLPLMGPQLAVLTLHPASLMREVTPLWLVVKDFERVRDYVRQGYKTMLCLGGKAGHLFMGIPESVLRLRGIYLWLRKGEDVRSA